MCIHCYFDKKNINIKILSSLETKMLFYIVTIKSIIVLEKRKNDSYNHN